MEKEVVKELTVIEARDRLKREKGLQLIDVRASSEFEKVSIEGFRNIPLADLSRAIPELDHNRETMLLCHHGTISHDAWELLDGCGIRAMVIRGGIDVWARVLDPKMARY